MAAHGDTAEGSAPRWTVAAVAARLGVAPATLRSWSHRYGIGPTDHRAGTYRRYTDDDVAELETMRRLADGGMVLSSAAALARRQRGRVTPGSHTADLERAGPVGDVETADVRALVAAARRLDVATLVHAVEDSLERRDVTTTWNQLCRPGLDALDSADSPTACLDGALMLARAITASLHRRFPAAASAARTRRVLLTCAPDEHHTLGLDALFAALSEHAVPVSVLGPATPLPALLHAVEHTRPLLVLVWAQRPATARPTALRRLVPHAVTVAGGPGWQASRLPGGARWVNSLDDAVNLAREVTMSELEPVDTQAAARHPPR